MEIHVIKSQFDFKVAGCENFQADHDFGMILGNGFYFANKIGLAFVNEGDFLPDTPISIFDLSLNC